MNTRSAFYRLFTFSCQEYPLANSHEIRVGNGFLGLEWFRSKDKGRNRLILHLFGLWIVFGQAGNCIVPAIHFQFHKSKDSIIGLLEITIRFQQWRETRVYVRLGQQLWRNYDWTAHKHLNPYHAWCIDGNSQHFGYLARHLAYPDGHTWSEPTWLKKHGVVDYEVASEAPSGDYIANARILFVKHDNIWM